MSPGANGHRFQKINNLGPYLSSPLGSPLGQKKLSESFFLNKGRIKLWVPVGSNFNLGS